MSKANNAMTFSDEQAMILESARDFCRDKSPIPAVRALLTSDSGYDAGVWQEMVALGWPGIAIPEEYGGSDLGIGSVVPLAESMGRSLLSTPFLSSTLAAQALCRGANSAQKENWPCRRDGRGLRRGRRRRLVDILESGRAGPNRGPVGGVHARPAPGIELL